MERIILPIVFFCLFSFELVSAQSKPHKIIFPSNNGYLVLNNYVNSDFVAVSELLSISLVELFGTSVESEYFTNYETHYSRLLRAEVNIRDQFVIVNSGRSKREHPIPNEHDIIFNYFKQCQCNENEKNDLLKSLNTIHPVYYNNSSSHTVGSYVKVVNQKDLKTTYAEGHFIFYIFSYIDRVVSDHLKLDNYHLVFLYVNYYFSGFTDTIILVKYFSEYDFSEIIKWGYSFSSKFSIVGWDYN